MHYNPRGKNSLYMRARASDIHSGRTLVHRAITASVIAAALTLCTSSVMAGFSADIANSQNTATSATQFLTSTDASAASQCTSTPIGAMPATASFACTGNVFPPQMPAAGSTTASINLKATGTAVPQVTEYRALSCAPAQLANSQSAANPMLPRYGVTYGAAGPLVGSVAATFDGVSGLADEAVQKTSPRTYTIATWFKTSTAGGQIMGFSEDGAAAKSGLNDRVLYLNSAGNVRFGVYPGGQQIISTTTSVADSAWHHVAASISIGSTTTIQTLYLDGAQASTASWANGAEQNYNGYWRLAQVGNSGWSGASGQYFNGLLSNAAVWPTALSLAQMQQLYASASQSAFTANVSALSPTSYWPLQDDGLHTFGGPYAVIGATSPCAQVSLSTSTSTLCIFPTLSCSTATDTFSNLVSSGSLTMSTPSLSAPMVLSTTVTRASGYSAYLAGLQLLLPIRVTQTSFNQVFTWSNNRIIL
jgi:hypothetical protein